MSLRYECPECGEEIVVRYLDPGDVAQCPHCGAEAAVPEDADVVDLPSTRADTRVLNPNLPSSRHDGRFQPGSRTPPKYWFLRILAWLILVGAALHIVFTLVMLGQLSGFRPGVNAIGPFLIWVPFEILIALGMAQGIWAIIEIVENTRAVLPPPADTFD